MLQPVGAESSQFAPNLAKQPPAPRHSSASAENTDITGNARKVCSICLHGRLADIDSALRTDGANIKAISAKFGVSYDALHRHRRAHLHAPPVVDGLPPAQIEISIQRNRLEAMDLRWKALVKQLRSGKGMEKLSAGALLKEIRELEALTAKETGTIGNKPNTQAVEGSQVIVVIPSAPAPTVPTAAIVSRAAQENWRATDDNYHYRERTSGESNAGQPTPPYTLFVEGAPTTDPKPYILPTHARQDSIPPTHTPLELSGQANSSDGSPAVPDPEDAELASLVGKLGGKKKLKKLLLMLLEDEE